MLPVRHWPPLVGLLCFASLASAGAAPSDGAFREHASLAWFSLGSLAVGGVFYGIHSSFDRSGSGQVSGNGSRAEIAVGAAGATAVAAGMAYLYYSLRGEGADETPAAGLSAGIGADGAVAAKLTLRLPALSK